MPLRGVKLLDGSPLTRTAKEGDEIQAYMRLMK